MPGWKVLFAPEAFAELQSASDYYEQLRDGLGTEFLLEFDTQIQLISTNPFTRAVRYLDVRFAILDRFPYAVHYTVKEDQQVIIIQTVLSTFKDPSVNWKQR